ncbi:MAG: CHAT domain-containing protein [Alphaproteobacteria bacterium]|nr:CHAT domain-containing protein [Alphaproteobacteria bacterium]MCB9797425.1 CHAT domain-containing protein [Alphaproteobacteria bacterium]
MEITELRHPTPAQLRETLTCQPGLYRVVHVDGHGLPGGWLLFEGREHGRLEQVRIQDLSPMLRDGEVQVLVMTACQSAAEDVQTGALSAAECVSHYVDGVVAMGWDLHVDGARRFVEGFYKALLDDQRELAEAVVRGREYMSAQRGRRVGWHVLPLHDWLNPVVFQSALLPVAPVKRGEPFPAARAAGISWHSGWPLTGTAAHGLPHGFIGRDQELHRLNRSWGQGRRLFHVHGPLGAGTTSFARWWLLSLARRRLLGGRIHYFNPTPTSASALYEELLKRLNAPCPASLGERRLMLGEVLGPDDVLLWDDFDPSASAGEGEHDNASEVTALMQTPAFRQAQRRLVLVGRAEHAVAGAVALPLGGLAEAESLRLVAEIAHERGVYGKGKYTELKLDALKGRTPGEILAYFEPESQAPGVTPDASHSTDKGPTPPEPIRKDPLPPPQALPAPPNPDFRHFSDYKLLADALFTQVGGYEELVTFLRGYAYTQRLVGQFARGALRDVCMSVAVLLLNRGYVDAAFLANLEALGTRSPPELGELRRRLGL